MDNKEVAGHLTTAVGTLRRRWGLECTLSEIFSLRRYIVESEGQQASEHFFWILS